MQPPRMRAGSRSIKIADRQDVDKDRAKFALSSGATPGRECVCEGTPRIQSFAAARSSIKLR